MVVRLLCRSTARLERETFTTVASTCPMRDPSTATAVIFQTSGSSRSTWFLALGKCGEHLIGRAHASETREDIFKGEAMMLGVLAGAGVFDKHKGEAEAGALSRRGLHAYIGGDACEDDRVDAAGFELLL